MSSPCIVVSKGNAFVHSPLAQQLPTRWTLDSAQSIRSSAQMNLPERNPPRKMWKSLTRIYRFWNIAKVFINDANSTLGRSKNEKNSLKSDYLLMIYGCVDDILMTSRGTWLPRCLAGAMLNDVLLIYQINLFVLKFFVLDLDSFQHCHKPRIF